MRLRGLPAVLLALTFLAVGACDAPPIDWQPEAPAVPGRGAAELASRRLTIGASGAGASLVSPPSLPAPDEAADGSGRVCDGSLRLVAGNGSVRVAAWWSVRPDSSALLLASVSTDSGRSWTTQTVDSLDRGVRGCSRPPPALAADSVNGYVHVVYFLDAPEGPGLFYAHLMDPRARFEPPAVIVYGTRPVNADVATAGDTVVVAYEDPNRPRPQVELALSRTGGHLFEERHIDVSGENVTATMPRVALAGGHVAVAWVESAGDGSIGGCGVVRVGRLR